MPVNELLHAAIQEAGWPLAETGTAINAVGAENGLRFWYDRTATAHWLSGTVPRKAALPCVVEAFARRLGRPVDAGNLGWPDPGEVIKDPWAGDPAVRLEEIGRGDMNRRTAISTGIYSVALLTIPAAVRRPPGRSRTETVTEDDVTRIQEATQHFADIDDLCGGGHGRAAIAAYLLTEVTPLLRGATRRTRPHLFRAASELAYLAGYMAADGGADNLAQRYFIQAIRLGDEAGDPLLRATALRSMAVQAIELGHPNKALDVAEEALDSLRSGCPERTRAWVTGAYAEAVAAAGSGYEARQALARAERGLDRADSLPESRLPGGYRRESLNHQAGTLLASLGDLKAAEAGLEASLGSRRTVERRTRALIGARLAVVQHRRGADDAAAHTLARIRPDLNAVASARVRLALKELPPTLA